MCAQVFHISIALLRFLSCSLALSLCKYIYIYILLSLIFLFHLLVCTFWHFRMIFFSHFNSIYMRIDDRTYIQIHNNNNIDTGKTTTTTTTTMMKNERMAKQKLKCKKHMEHNPILILEFNLSKSERVEFSSAFFFFFCFFVFFPSQSKTRFVYVEIIAKPNTATEIRTDYFEQFSVH